MNPMNEQLHGRRLPRKVAAAVASVAALAAALVAAPAHADDQVWIAPAAICLGSASGQGQIVQFSINDDTVLQGASDGDEVWWQPVLHVYDPVSGTMWWREVNEGQWKHYTLRKNGAGAEGSYTVGPGGVGITLNYGGTTAPGLWRTPVDYWVEPGKWVIPYVRSWGKTRGYAMHPVPVLANGVAVDPTYGCYYS